MQIIPWLLTEERPIPLSQEGPEVLFIYPLCHKIQTQRAFSCTLATFYNEVNQGQDVWTVNVTGLQRCPPGALGISRQWGNEEEALQVTKCKASWVGSAFSEWCGAYTVALLFTKEWGAKLLSWERVETSTPSLLFLCPLSSPAPLVFELVVQVKQVGIDGILLLLLFFLILTMGYVCLF